MVFTKHDAQAGKSQVEWDPARLCPKEKCEKRCRKGTERQIQECFMQLRIDRQ